MAATRAGAGKKRTVLVTGGAGFIGVNAARRFLQKGWNVVIWDNMSRCGAARNLKWLRETGDFEFVQTDLRSEKAVNRHFSSNCFDFILHCAGQVAVTSSVTDPREDFECNAVGTFNLLEGMRRFCRDAFLIYTSTNKVYGGMEDTTIVERHGRYEYKALPNGVSESQPLDFHSPYGCSKGAADQYVRDYSRIYGLATTCFRQSCIYGYRQFGVEDQGWVAWFMIAHALGRQINIYGDGKQSRDILFIDDLVDAYFLAWKQRHKASGEVYNIGGGPKNQLSLLQLVKFLEFDGSEVNLKYAPSRPGDQRVFVSDIRKAHNDLKWTPAHSGEDGLWKLRNWIDANVGMFREIVNEPRKQSGPRLSGHQTRAKASRGA